MTIYIIGQVLLAQAFVISLFNIIEMTEHVVQGQSRAIEIPKYSEDTQKKL